MTTREIQTRIDEVKQDITMLEDGLKKYRDSDDLRQRFRAEALITHYLTIATYGIIESKMKKLLEDYITQHCPSNLHNILKDTLKTYGWDFGKIKEMLGKFNQEWQEEAKNNIDEKMKQAITNIKNRRDKIAHGDSFDTTLESAKRDFKKAMEGLIIIAGIIESKSAPSTQTDTT